MVAKLSAKSLLTITTGTVLPRYNYYITKYYFQVTLVMIQKNNLGSCSVNTLPSLEFCPIINRVLFSLYINIFFLINSEQSCLVVGYDPKKVIIFFYKHIYCTVYDLTDFTGFTTKNNNNSGICVL